MGIPLGSNIDHYSKKFLDSRESSPSYDDLITNAKKIKYPVGFIVYCELEKKRYINSGEVNGEPVWEEYGISKAYVYQEEEPDDKNVIWCKPSDCIERIDNEFTTDELVALVKNYKSVTDALIIMLQQLQKEVEDIKKNGVIIDPSKPSTGNIDGGIITETGAYLVTETGAYLVIE